MSVAGALAIAVLATFAMAQHAKRGGPAPGGSAVQHSMKPESGEPGNCMKGMGKGMSPAECAMGRRGCCMKGMGMGPAGRGMGRRGCCMPMRGGDGPAMGPGMGFGGGLERLHELDLSPEQKTKLMGIHDRQQRLAIQKQADVRLAELDLRQMLRDEKPDKMKIDAQIDKLARLRADLQKSRVAALLEARTVLTPEQLKKWREGPAGDKDEGEEED
jgi:Spy/CpxP family protein refolding chaperone